MAVSLLYGSLPVYTLCAPRYTHASQGNADLDGWSLALVPFRFRFRPLHHKEFQHESKPHPRFKQQSGNVQTCGFLTTKTKIKSYATKGQSQIVPSDRAARAIANVPQS